MNNEAKSRFIFEHAEKCLMATLKDAEALGQNCVYVAGVFVAALSACGAMVIKDQHSFSVVGAALISGVYLAYSAWRFTKSTLSARSIKNPGNLSSNLQKPPYSEKDISDLLLSEASGYDLRICENAARNKETGIGLNRAIRALLIFPAIFLMTWLLFQLAALLVGVIWTAVQSRLT